MDKVYDYNKTEEGIYKLWEKGGYFKPKINKKKKPFTILIRTGLNTINITKPICPFRIRILKIKKACIR